MIPDQLITTIITMLGAGGLATGLTSYVKDRKKDNATAKMTDVQALQQEVVLLTQVCEFLRSENNQLRKDYIGSEDQRRELRMRIGELEKELEKLKALTRTTQERCDMLARQLRGIMQGEDNKNG